MNSEPTYNLLNSINYPEDLRKLTVEQLPEVCGEVSGVAAEFFNNVLP